MKKTIERSLFNPLPIPSSTIEGYHYDRNDRILYLKFITTNDYAYGYHDFNDTDHKKFLEAESTGKHVRKEVIPNHHAEKFELI